MSGHGTTPTHIKIAVVAVFILFLPAIICVIDGFGTLAKQAIMWFKLGYWVPIEFWSGVYRWFPSGRPSLNWAVPNNVLNWMLDGPRWVWMIVTGVALFGIELFILVKALRLYASMAARRLGVAT